MKRGYVGVLVYIEKSVGFVGMLFLKYLISKKYICKNEDQF